MQLAFERGSWVRRGLYLVSATTFIFTAAAPVGAVPIPWKNCGAAGDILSVQKLDASIWPPPTAAPLAGTAMFDPVTGQLTNLRVLFLFGPEWIFESGALPTSLSSGFVSLPATVPMSVTSPPLPVAAGPYSTSHTFTSPGGAGSVTVSTKANLAVALSSPLTNLSLTFNGISGFPVPPAPGLYEARVQMTLPSGTEVFCADFTLKDISFVSAATPAPVPTLSRQGRVTLLLLLVGCGLFALRRGVG